MKQELLRIEKCRKGSLLKSIYLQIFEGEMINLVFDNVQEKQMFLQIIRGYEKLDFGQVYYKENIVKSDAFLNIFQTNIKVISKEDSLIYAFSIAENIFLSRPIVKAIWNSHTLYKKNTSQLFQAFFITLDIDKPTKDLTIFERIQVEIIKAYSSGQRMVFLTSVISFFSNIEIDLFQKLIKRLKLEGMSFVLVEPFEDIRFEDLDMVFVVKHGKTIAIKECEEPIFFQIQKILYSDKVLDEPRIVSKRGEWGNEEKQYIKFVELYTELLSDFSLQLEKGKILKIFCDDVSFDELQAVFRGNKVINRGRLVLGKKNIIIKNCLKGLAYGIGLVEEISDEKMLFRQMSVMDNLCIPLSAKVSGMWMTRKYRSHIKEYIKEILPPEILLKKVSELDSLTIQKLVYLRWLLYAPDMVICIRPFSKGDMKVRDAICDMILQLANRGIAVIILSTNIADQDYCKGENIYVKHGKIISRKETDGLLKTNTMQ